MESGQLPGVVTWGSEEPGCVLKCGLTIKRGVDMVETVVDGNGEILGLVQLYGDLWHSIPEHEVNHTGHWIKKFPTKKQAIDNLMGTS